MKSEFLSPPESPLPWHNRGCFISDANERGIATGEGSGNYAINVANAALIVHAVNRLPALESIASRALALAEIIFMEGGFVEDCVLRSGIDALRSELAALQAAEKAFRA